MAHKVSGRCRYFHSSANNYSLLTSPTHITGLEDLRALQDLADAHGWANDVASLMPDSARWVVCVTNVELTLYHDLAAPTQSPLDLSDCDDDSDDDVPGSDDDDVDASEYRRQGRVCGLLDEGPHPRHKALVY